MVCLNIDSLSMHVGQFDSPPGREHYTCIRIILLCSKGNVQTKACKYEIMLGDFVHSADRAVQLPYSNYYLSYTDVMVNSISCSCPIGIFMYIIT